MLKKLKAKLTRKYYLNPETIFARLALPEPLGFSAGQYIIVDIPDKEGVKKRLYSIASPESDQKNIELIIKIIPQGVGSEFFKTRRPGDFIDITGPAGLFTLKRNDQPKVFLATGTGIAPIRSMLKSYAEEKPKEPLFLFWGMRKRSDLYLVHEYEKLERELPSFKYFFCLSREKGKEDHIYPGYVQQAAEDLLSQDLFSAADFYICGGRGMVDDLQKYLLQKGIQKERLHFERF